MTVLDFHIRILLHETIELVQGFVLSAVAAVVLFRLGNMQFSGLLTFAGAATGLLFAFTSLQYNRARAYRSGAAQRRSLMAAEITLRATLAFTLGAILTSMIYLFLATAGYQPTPENRWPTQILPGLFAFVPLAFFTYTILMLAKSTRILLHGMRGRLTLRHLSKNT